MDIDIRHLSNTFNYGSLMMGVNIIKYLNTEFPSLNIYVDIKKNDISNMDRLKREVLAENIYNIDDIYIQNRIKRGISNVFKSIGNGRKRTIIFLGGDDISEYYGSEYLKSILLGIKKQSEYSNIILIGQTIGPFSDENRKNAVDTLNRVSIYTRDNKCKKYLESIGVKNIKNGRDLAFLELPNQIDADEILDKYNIRDEKYITMVPSGLWKLYTGNYEQYLKSYKNIICKILDREDLSDYKILFLPHVIKPDHVDDRNVIKDLIGMLKPNYKKRIIYSNGVMLASEARAILGNGLFTITGRMHAAVSTFFMRKPAISVSYSIKYDGVISEGLNLRELVVEANDSTLWENGEIDNIILEKVDYIMGNYKNLRRKIDTSVSENTEMAEESLKLMCSEIRSYNKRGKV